MEESIVLQRKLDKRLAHNRYSLLSQIQTIVEEVLERDVELSYEEMECGLEYMIIGYFTIGEELFILDINYLKDRKNYMYITGVYFYKRN